MLTNNTTLGGTAKYDLWAEAAWNDGLLYAIHLLIVPDPLGAKL